MKNRLTTFAIWLLSGPLLIVLVGAAIIVSLKDDMADGRGRMETLASERKLQMDLTIAGNGEILNEVRAVRSDVQDLIRNGMTDRYTGSEARADLNKVDERLKVIEHRLNLPATRP